MKDTDYARVLMTNKRVYGMSAEIFNEEIATDALTGATMSAWSFKTRDGKDETTVLAVYDVDGKVCWAYVTTKDNCGCCEEND